MKSADQQAGLIDFGWLERRGSMLRRKPEHAVIDVKVDVGNWEIGVFDDFPERYVIAVAGADKDTAAVFDKELPQLELPQPRVFPGSELQDRDEINEPEAAGTLGEKTDTFGVVEAREPMPVKSRPTGELVQLGVKRVRLHERTLLVAHDGNADVTAGSAAPNAGMVARNGASFAVALKRGTGSSSLKAEVNAFERLHIVRGWNSSYSGSK